MTQRDQSTIDKAQYREGRIAILRDRERRLVALRERLWSEDELELAGDLVYAVELVREVRHAFEEQR